MTLDNQHLLRYGLICPLLTSKQLQWIERLFQHDKDGNQLQEDGLLHVLDLVKGDYDSVISMFPDSSPLSKSGLLSLCGDTTQNKEHLTCDISTSGSKFTVDCIHRYVTEYINDSIYPSEQCKKVFDCLLLGVAYFETYCQANYSGPELSPALMNSLTLSNDTAAASCHALECDGVYCFSSVEIPQTLLIARSVLAAVADPSRAGWQSGIRLSESGAILKAIRSTGTAATPSSGGANHWSQLSASLSASAAWWSARATVVHGRSLQKLSYDAVPTLWKECQDMFDIVLQHYTGTNNACVSSTMVLSQGSTAEGPSGTSAPATEPAAEPAAESLCKAVDAIVSQRPSLHCEWLSEEYTEYGSKKNLLLKHVAAQAWLEWGLCCHHFGYPEKGKKFFSKARDAAGLEVKISAALGKRTKYQQKDIAQLYLYAKSHLVGLNTELDSADAATAAAAAQMKDSTNNPIDTQKLVVEQTGDSAADPAVALTAAGVTLESSSHQENQEDQDGQEGKDTAWQHGEWELGRRLVREGAGGEEVAVREVLLDSVDGGAAENIILEGGPRFTAATNDTADTASATATAALVNDVVVDKGGELHSLDQAIILALCLDVSNSNPVDGLTNEEMQPYVERVLDRALNWMVYSTGLLQRSWLEFERRKTMDRAMLQIQALIDQHSTKLTLMQSTYQSVTEESAPVQERLRYLYSIVYPAQYELKRDLAVRYMRCQVFASALNYFRELELWDEVVACYQFMSKPHRAELVVREQLQLKETPYMLTSLADLTGQEDLYLKAWELSNHRFARPLRTLAKACYDRGEFLACITHLDNALAVHPLVATAWYLRGIACMHLEHWDEAITSFVRCVQQDMEIGEAWANIGAVHMRNKSWQKAHHALTEALRHKRDSWKILENLMSVSIALGRWQEVVLHMNSLLDMRHQSERPVHKDELRHVCYIVSCQAKRDAQLHRDKHKQSNAIPDCTADNTAGSIAGSNYAGENGSAEIASINMNLLQCLRLDDEDEDDCEDDEYLGAVAVDPLSHVVSSVEKLLTRVTTAIKSDPEVWDIFADFNHNLGRISNEMDCRMKQFRALVNDNGWEKIASKIEDVAAAAHELVRAHRFKGVKKADLYSCRMLLQSTLRKIEAVDPGNEAVNKLKHLAERLAAAHDIV